MIGCSLVSLLGVLLAYSLSSRLSGVQYGISNPGLKTTSHVSLLLGYLIRVYYSFSSLIGFHYCVGEGARTYTIRELHFFVCNASSWIGHD